MILTKIKSYMIEHKVVTLNNLALHFETDKDAMREMLGTWIRKGRVVQVEHEDSCRAKGCFKGCSKEEAEIYEWISK